MQFTFTPEQEQFREVVRRFAADKSSADSVRQLMATDAAFDEAVWRELCELGIAALAIPEDCGGQGFGPVETGIVMEEMGRSLLLSPYFSSAVLAATTLVEAADEAARQRWLPRIASGECRATLALVDDDMPLDAQEIGVMSVSNGRLTGRRRFVVDGATAGLLLVLARTAEGEVALYAVEADAAGVTRRRHDTLDESRRLAHIDFADAAAERIDAGGAAEAFPRIVDRVAVALANETVGVTDHLFASVIDYTAMRMQFGRSIASFQAVKHRCADLLLTLELARSGAYGAAAALADDDADQRALASMALASAAEAGVTTAKEAVQLHGGIGFTWDHDTHLWFKRAKSSEVLLGLPARHRERMLRHWPVPEIDQEAS